MDYKKYAVSARDKEPLLAFVHEALVGQGCEIMKSTGPGEAPFRISFKTPSGERLGIVCYAFLANTRLTKNRPADEHRFQVKYGPNDGKRHRIWQDGFGMYTTLFVGINPDLGLFVGADPEIHNPTRFFISIEFKEAHVQTILKEGWHAWERERRSELSLDPIEVLVGGTKEHFLDYVRFEQMAQGLDQGHRQLLAEKLPLREILTIPKTSAPFAKPGPKALHALVQEFQLTETEVLDLIASAPRLKMAVRGWVAEEHLVRTLDKVPGVTECWRLDGEGPDVKLLFEGKGPLTLQCKNVLRKTMADGRIRVDFQKTRASKDDYCSRYYRPEEFDLVAACIHAITERWEFRYTQPRLLDPHPKCAGRLSQNVRLDTRWTDDAAQILRAACKA